MRHLLIASLLLCACHPDTSLTFPKGFLWGTATAAHQSEGRNTLSDWQAFEDMGRVDKAGWAQNTLDLFETDSANAKSLGMNSFQLGIEWARIVPKRPADPFGPLTADDVDPVAVAHYHDVLTSLRSRGITPIVAVTHFSLPKWVHNPAAYDENTHTFTDGSLGGWAGPDTTRSSASRRTPSTGWRSIPARTRPPPSACTRRGTSPSSTRSRRATLIPRSSAMVRWNTTPTGPARSITSASTTTTPRGS
jgi:hypothetical protein